MNCRQCEPILEAYALDELAQTEEYACRAHLETCPDCRRLLADYAHILSAISESPAPTPSSAESMALAQALSQVHLGPECKPAIIKPLPQGFPGFLLASALAFVFIVSFLAMQACGVISAVSLVSEIGLKWVALMVVVTIIVTSFIPIAVTARRRPLNGMTFRR